MATNSAFERASKKFFLSELNSSIVLYLPSERNIGDACKSPQYLVSRLFSTSRSVIKSSGSSSL